MPAEPTTRLLLVLLAPAIAGLMGLLIAVIWEPPPLPSPPGSRKPVAILSVGDAFDPEHAVIWEAQLPMLESLVAGVEEAEFRAVWEKLRRRFPELYEGTRASDWVEFLCRSQVAETPGRRICLTPQGRQFVESLARYSALHR